MTELSVIVPFYNEYESLPELVRRLFETLDDSAFRESLGTDPGFEIIMVDETIFLRFKWPENESSRVRGLERPLSFSGEAPPGTLR